MTKHKRNPDETNEQILARMNETLVGRHGIAMVDERPKYLGTFVRTEEGSNPLFHFTNETVLFFSPIGLLSIIGEKKKDGGYPSKDICENLFIGDESLGEIFADEVEDPPPPQPPSVWRLIEETGTFTGCKEMVDRFIGEGKIWKMGKTLHVSMAFSDMPGCMCGVTDKVEHLESLVRDLKKFFEARKVVFHHTVRTADIIATVEVAPGTKGRFYDLPGNYDGDPSCGTYPVIKGLGMSWVPLEK